MKFKAERTIADMIEEITKQFNLGEPSEFLIYLPEDTDNAATGWADNSAILASLDLKHKVLVLPVATIRALIPLQAAVHLKRKYQVARVVNKENLKNILFDWSGVTVGEWLPIVGKKFDQTKCDNMHLYISGSAEREYLVSGSLPLC